MPRHFGNAGTSSRGSALIVVLVMFGVISVVAVAVARSVSGAALELRQARVDSNEEADLRAGIELAVGAILELGDDMRSGDAQANLPDRHISVRFTNERARIDLNMADPEVLTGLFKSSGVDDGEASALAMSIIQYRGGPALKELTPVAAPDDHAFGEMPGATHLNAGLTDQHKPPAAPQVGTHFLFHPSQLASLPGFSKALVKAIFPFVTVANGADQVNPFIAEGGVLEALPDSSASKVEGFLTVRDGNISSDTALQMLGVDKKYLSQDASPGWRVQVVTSRRGRVRRSEAIVVVLKDDSEPYHVLYVVDDPAAT